LDYKEKVGFDPMQAGGSKVSVRPQPVCRLFSEAAIRESAPLLVATLQLEQNAESALQRRWLLLETLDKVGDNHAIGLATLTVRLAIQPDRSR
jgi:hypothetical protein